MASHAVSRCSINSRAVMELLKHPLVTLVLELALISFLPSPPAKSRTRFDPHFVVQWWDKSVGAPTEQHSKQ